MKLEIFKNLIARLAFHLVSGSEDSSLQTRTHQSMNVISYVFLDFGPVVYKKA